jgi:hypothetical protein
MSSDQLLNGDAGPEAQANEVLRLLNEEMMAVSQELLLTSGNSRTITGGDAVFLQEGGAA